ncbi:MAG: M28 family peptidase [Luteibaculum sp.]
MKTLFLLLFSFSIASAFGQTNFVVTNTAADQVLHGNYDPNNFPGSTVAASTYPLLINQLVNPDTLKEYIIKLSTFRNRNTGSDTVSTETGIGAARRWVHQKFEEYSSFNSNLLPAYFQFDQEICEVNQHRNIIAVLPGFQVEDPSPIVIEGHIDSRCAGVCDIDCIAEGVEDNATGTALVMELARVLAPYKLKRTLVFMVTIGEEQGLHGADAFAKYCNQENINVRAVFNNDVIGGIICGETASPPGCTGEGDIDSTSVRIFSDAIGNSPSKGLARFAKLEYQEDLKPFVSVPMELRIMSPEDRTGRGGDHIPFRVAGYPAIRYCAANEHGDASNGPDYDDRQHTEDDILGIDTDNDQVIDSFFVDFNYLARNTVINGTSAAAAANGLLAPNIVTKKLDDGSIEVTIVPAEEGVSYKIGVRTLSNDFDSIYETRALVDTVSRIGSIALYFLSAAVVDDQGIESLFSEEKRVISAGGTSIDEEEFKPKGVYLGANKPNPFDEATNIMFEADANYAGKKASIVITDLSGKEIRRMEMKVEPGFNEVLYRHGYGVTGTFLYSLYIDGQHFGTKPMVFAN